jgi:hypothetical protein
METKGITSNSRIRGWKIRQIKAAMHRRYWLAPVSREYGKMEEVSMEINDVKCICVARYPIAKPSGRVADLGNWDPGAAPAHRALPE